MTTKVSRPFIGFALLFLVTPALAQGPRVVRWQDGSPGSRQFKRDRVVVKQVETDGVVVEAFIRDSRHGIRVDLKVSNGGPSHLDVRPESVEVELTSPKSKSLAYVPAKNLGNIIRSSSQSRATSKSLSGSMATKTVAETETKWVDVTTYGADGPKTESRLVTETKFKTVPDDHARWQAESEASHIRTSAQGEAYSLVKYALKPATLQTGASASGALYFSRDSSAKEVILRVPLGDLSVEIPFKVFKKRVFLLAKALYFE